MRAGMLRAGGALALACLVLAGCGRGDAPAGPIEIKFSHVVAADTPKGRAAEEFRRLAQERTHGRVKVTVFPNSQLYKDKEEIEALQLGSVQMLAPSLAKFGPLGAREFEVFDLPYLFDGYESVHKVTQGPVGHGMLERLASRGITGLGFWDNGFKDLSANREIRTPADVRGLKLRIQSSQVLAAQMKTLGALPQVMAFSEVYPALETGVVDGTENPPSNFYTQKMYEVQKYLARTQHGYLGYAVIVNKKFWDGLPADLRTTLEVCMAEATKFANDIAQQENEQALEKVRASGRTRIVELDEAGRAAFRKALLPVHREMRDVIGPELIDSIYAATGFRAQ
ncbi:MAG TPA: TRAP transporter substrate-binding protein [Candidatus Binatia bacterium]|nr:TRAP transporter substrate-binding protein [Candidatus Binatia bacterium]